MGLAIEPGSARRLAEAGMRIKRAADAAIHVRHPELPGLEGIAYIMFYDADGDDPAAFRTSTVLPPGRLDRSPCGTGSSALLATLHARGRARVGDRLRTRSAIGSEFRLDLLGETRAADRAAVRPRVSGPGVDLRPPPDRRRPRRPLSPGLHTLADCWGDGGACGG